MAKWRKEDIFLTPLFKFKCLGCKDPQASFTELGYQLMNFPIYNDKPEKYDAHALDRTFKCCLCGFKLLFGLAVSKEHAKQIKEWYDSNEGKHERRKEREVAWGS